MAKRHRGGARNDTLVSAGMLREALAAICGRKRVMRRYEVPYLAGYSTDGRRIYIDRDLPKTFMYRGRRVKVDPFLILHESIEKALLDELGLCYQHAHQVALRAEEAAVRASGVSWREYDRFMQRYVKEAYEDRVCDLPPDLDVKPYRDERDMLLLQRMLDEMATERRSSARDGQSGRTRGRRSGSRKADRG